MSGYANFKKYDLKHSDFDFRDELKLSSLLALTQESAGASADELGFGYTALKQKRCGFLIVHTYAELFCPIVLGDALTVETWPLPPRHFIFRRDSRLFDGAGKEVAAVASRWCLVDLDDFSLQLPARMGEVHDRCPYRAEEAVSVPNWKIPPLQNGQKVYSFTVRNSVCDHYLHANNARYLDFFTDCFSMDELSSRRVRAFRIAYERQAREGVELTLCREDRGASTLLEARSEEEVFTRCELIF